MARKVVVAVNGRLSGVFSQLKRALTALEDRLGLSGGWRMRRAVKPPRGLRMLEVTSARVSKELRDEGRVALYLVEVVNGSADEVEWEVLEAALEEGRPACIGLQQVTENELEVFEQ